MVGTAFQHSTNVSFNSSILPVNYPRTLSEIISIKRSVVVSTSSILKTIFREAQSDIFKTQIGGRNGSCVNWSSPVELTAS